MWKKPISQKEMSRVPLLVLTWCIGRCAGWPFGISVTFPEMLLQFQTYSILPPFINSNFHLPQSPSQQAIIFRLYTPDNPTTPQILEARQASTVRGSNFSTQRGTVFIVHGFTESGSKQWILDMVNETPTQGINVVVVDWQNGAKGPDYFKATANTRVVGNHLATLLLMLNDSLGVPFSSMHVIGHSLGAHIAGYAGQGGRRQAGQNHRWGRGEKVGGVE